MFGLDIPQFIITIACLAFFVIALLAPIWLFLAQAYARECRDELKETNNLLKTIADGTPVITAGIKLADDPLNNRVKKTMCTSCQKEFTYPTEHSWRNVKCPGCGHDMILP